MLPRASHRYLSLLLLLLCANISLYAQNQPAIASDMELPLAADQTAQAIGLKPLFDRLRTLSTSLDSADRLEFYVLQQQAMLRITTASLAVDASAEQVDSEIAEIRELENYLTSRRDSRVVKLNLMALVIGGAAGTASSALGYTSHDNAAATLGVIGGVGATVLSLVALHINKGESRELMVQSNMLSKVFAHPSDANNVYPPIVVTFMNAIAPNDEDGLSRQDRLINDWVQVGRIPDPKLPEGHEKINRLVSLPGQKIEQSIGDLEDRQAMLYDLRVRLNYMKLDLAILLASLPTLNLPDHVNEILISPTHASEAR